MSAPADSPLKRTSLHATHVALGARMVPFGGWDMPVQYSGISAEHKAVRTAAGLFDISHMGRRARRAGRAGAASRHALTNDVATLKDGQVRYGRRATTDGTSSTTCSSTAGAERLPAGRQRLQHREGPRLAREHTPGRPARCRRQLERPLRDGRGAGAEGARDRRSRSPPSPLDGHQVLRFAHGEVAGMRGTVVAHRLHRRGRLRGHRAAAVRAGAVGGAAAGGEERRAVPCGLGARDTLRLEAAMPLYGHDMDETTTVLECRPGLDRRLEQGRRSSAATVLRRQKAEGTARKLVGFEMVEPRPSPARATPSVTTAPRSAR